MKKQLPKNVRQIGNVSDSPKIYVEDYVDTFLNQLCDKAGQSPKGAFLIGEVMRGEEDEYIYIYGALHMKQFQVQGKEIQVGENTWKYACEQCKKYFGDAGIIGWGLVANGQALEVTHGIAKVHQRFFPRDKSVFIIKDAETKEEKFYLRKFHDLLEWGGHYVYYEKNAEMQSYMIDSRKKNGVSPSENVEDRAAASFRSVIKERMEKQEQKKHSGFRYAVSVLLVLLVFGIGVTIMNRYEEVSDVKDVVDVISGVISPEEKKETVIVEIEDRANQEQTEDPTKEIESDGKDDEKETEKAEDSGKADQTDESDNKETDQTEKTDDTQESDADLETAVTENSYTVQKGDTLASISKERYGTVSYVDAICKMNGLEDGNLIFVGQKLLLP